jgi:hypothetical protein
MSSTYVDQALMTYFLARPAFSAVVGSRLYHIRAPKSAPLPYAVLMLVAPDNDAVVMGTGKAGHHTFQVLTVSLANQTGSDAFLAAQAVITAIRHYSGSMDGVTVRNVTNLRGPIEMADPQFHDRVNCVVAFDVEYEEVA